LTALVLAFTLALSLVSGPVMAAAARRAWYRHDYLRRKRLLARALTRSGTGA
jgi:hypothetical protein